MPDFIPKNDTEFAAWLANFNTIANANLAALGLVAADVTANVTNTTTLNTAIATNVTAQAAALAATQGKKTARRTVELSSRTLARRIQANPAVSNALKEQLGLTVRNSPPTAIVPVAPADLVVSGSDSGVNLLQWKGNGNKSGTQYLIETKIGAATQWTITDVTTKAKYSHVSQTPGVKAMYRVRAKRGDVLSGYSNEAIVYGT